MFKESVTMSDTTMTVEPVVLKTERDINLWQAASALHAACRAAQIALATAVGGEELRFARQVVEAALDRVSDFDDAGGASAASDPRPSGKAERC
jgi:hypothetical protein